MKNFTIVAIFLATLLTLSLFLRSSNSRWTSTPTISSQNSQNLEFSLDDDKDPESNATVRPSSSIPAFAQLKDVTKAYPYLAQVAEMRNKVLRSRREESLLNRKLLDPTAIETSIKLLSARDDQPFSAVDERARMLAIDHMREVINRSDSQLRQRVLKQLTEICVETSRRFHSLKTADPIQRRKQNSLLGDRLELASLIAEVSPENMDLIAKSSKGTLFEKLLGLAVQTEKENL